jgi:peptidoglycan-associated lipoprotein
MKRHYLFAVVLVIMAFFVFQGCASRKVSTPAGTQEGMQTGEQGAQNASEATEATTTEHENINEQEIASIETTKIQEPKVAKITEEEKAEIFRDIHFDFDKSDIRDDDRPILRKIADWMIEHPSVKLVIEGHCDERGTNEYNLALGDRRASAAKQYLVSLGVSMDRLSTVSYGEERPICTEHNESCWQRNRRAHFVVIQAQ